MIVYVYDSEKQCSVPIISSHENELDHLKLMSKVKSLKFYHLKKPHLHHAIVGVTDNIYKHDAYMQARCVLTQCVCVSTSVSVCVTLCTRYINVGDSLRKSACAICVIIV